jgi:hypothetical protein
VIFVDKDANLTRRLDLFGVSILNLLILKMLSTSLKIIRNNIKNPSIRYFSTGGHSLRYFMVEYTYEQDAYYKKSKSTRYSNQLCLVPHMEDHQKAVERL